MKPCLKRSPLRYTRWRSMNRLRHSLPLILIGLVSLPSGVKGSSRRNQNGAGAEAGSEYPNATYNYYSAYHVEVAHRAHITTNCYLLDEQTCARLKACQMTPRPGVP